MKTIWQTLKNELEELIYPTRCLGCDQPKTWFCQTCQQASSLPELKTDCALCYRLVNQPGKLCPNCQRQTNLNGLSFYAKFSQPMRRAIHLIKYQNCWAGLSHLTRLALIKWRFPITDANLVAIPLSDQKLRKRGYNQSQLIAKEISYLSNLVLSDCLVRNRHTKSQVGLSRIERQTNLLDCFSTITQPPAKVVLIDDVYTTGSTLKEAARALRLAGCQSVWGLALAKD